MRCADAVYNRPYNSMTGMPDITKTSLWHALADRVLDDHRLTADEGLADPPQRRRGTA